MYSCFSYSTSMGMTRIIYAAYMYATDILAHSTSLKNINNGVVNEKE